MTETLAVEIKKVPKKYWVIVGVALLLLFLYVRKRNAVSTQTSAATDNLTSAMSIPGGIQYAPITSGVTGGTGNNQSDISSVFGNNAMRVDGVQNTTSQTPSNNYAANNTYLTNASNYPTATDGLNVTADVNLHGGTGVYLPNGNEITVGDIGNYVKVHPLDSAQAITELYNYGHSIGLNNVDISNLRSYAREDFGVNPVLGYGVTLTGSTAMPSGLTAGVLPSPALTAPTPTPTPTPVITPAPVSVLSAQELFLKQHPEYVGASQANINRGMNYSTGWGDGTGASSAGNGSGTGGPDAGVGVGTDGAGLGLGGGTGVW